MLYKYVNIAYREISPGEGKFMRDKQIFEQSQ